jgi:hypothetical protein
MELAPPLVVWTRIPPTSHGKAIPTRARPIALDDRSRWASESGFSPSERNDKSTIPRTDDVPMCALSFVSPFADHLNSPLRRFGLSGLLTAIDRPGIVERIDNRHNERSDSHIARERGLASASNASVLLSRISCMHVLMAHRHGVLDKMWEYHPTPCRMAIRAHSPCWIKSDRTVGGGR